MNTGTVTIDLIPTHLRVEREATFATVTAELGRQGLKLYGVGAKVVALPICGDELTRRALIRNAVDALDRHKVDGRACRCGSCNELRAIAARLERQ